MAIGSSNISKARTILDEMEKCSTKARETNEQLNSVLNNENYKTFIRETQSGEVTNQQLTKVHEWSDKLITTIDSLNKVTRRFLDNQESYNQGR